MQQDHKRAPGFEALEAEDKLREAQAQGFAVLVLAVGVAAVGAQDGAVGEDEVVGQVGERGAGEEVRGVWVGAGQGGGREAVAEGEEVHVQVCYGKPRVLDEDFVPAGAGGEGDAGDVHGGVHVEEFLGVAPWGEAQVEGAEGVGRWVGDGEGGGLGLHAVGDLLVHGEELPFAFFAGVHHAFAFLLVELVAVGAAPSLV